MLETKQRRLRKDMAEIASKLSVLVFLAVWWAFLVHPPFTTLLAERFGGINAMVAAAGIAFIAMLIFAIVFAFILSKLANLVSPVYQTSKGFDFEITSEDLTPKGFEKEVAALINRLTGHQTVVTGGGGDGGIDIKVYNQQKRLIGIVQCKRFAANKALPPAYIRDLNTAKHYNHVNIAYLVTTGRFTQKSVKLAKELGIRLIDGAELKRMKRKAQQKTA